VRWGSASLLGAALLVGGWLRFTNLDATQMTADEGASWAAASAPTVVQAVLRSRRLNPGKLGLHDALMHVWMRIGGDSLASMRGLSAALGAIAIALVFAVVAEILKLDTDRGAEDSARERRDWIAAATAMVFALDVLAIAQSRIARMYMVLMVAVLAQVWFFVRAIRAGGFRNRAGLAITSALAVAAHFSAGLVLLSEVGWAALRLRRNHVEIRRWTESSEARAVAAIGVGGLMLAPLARTPLGIAYGFVRAGNLSWIPRPTLMTPVSVFIESFGRYGTVAIAAFALFAVISTWRTTRESITFLVLWALFPPLLLTAISFVQPIFVVYYVMSSAVPIAALAAIGFEALPMRPLRWVALACVVALLVTPVRVYFALLGESHFVRWGSAVSRAREDLKPGELALVEPDWAVNVVRYYLRAAGDDLAERARFDRLDTLRATPTVLISSDNANIDDPVGVKWFLWTAPDVVARFPGVTVRTIRPDRMAELRSLVRDHPDQLK